MSRVARCGRVAVNLLAPGDFSSTTDGEIFALVGCLSRERRTQPSGDTGREESRRGKTRS
jgi:hypothetical protein